MDCLLGIDVGSTSMKALVYDLDGNVISRGSRPTESIANDPDHANWQVYLPDHIWGGIASAIREAVSQIGPQDRILAGIYNGTVVGTAAYSSIAPAKWAMSEMVNLLNGAPIPGVVFYANMAITKDNVEAAFEHYYPGKTLADYLAGKVQ